MSRIYFLTAIACLPVAAMGQSSGDWLGKERGPFTTGVVQEIWFDENRAESATADPEDRRRLSIQIWYPAEISDDSNRAIYAQEIDDYDQSVRESWGKAATRETNSYRDADLSRAQAAYPVLLYSPGFWLPVFTGTYQTEYLASHGYIVVAIGHTGFDSRVRFPDGILAEVIESQPGDIPDIDDSAPLIERYRLSSENRYMARRRDQALDDISFVIDELARLNESRESRFYHRLDLAHVGGLGFSLGGADYFEATVTEPRLSAVVNLDGSLSTHNVVRTGARKPILLIQSTDGNSRVINGDTDAQEQELYAEIEREIWQMLRLSGAEWYKAAIVGTIHPHFSDLFLIVPEPDNMSDPQRVHMLVNRITREFFDQQLRGALDTPILDREETHDGLLLVTKRAP